MIAHRGICRDGLHENTLSAFAIALEHTDGIECDVRLSSDRVPVVIHDHTLNRTHKIDRRVQDCPSEYLRSIGVPTVRDIALLAHRVPFRNLILR